MDIKNQIGQCLKAKMPVILLETLADFDLLAFEVYAQVNLKIQYSGGGGGGVRVRGASLLCVFKKCLNELPFRESYKLNSPDHSSLH